MTEPTQSLAHSDSSQLISFEGLGLNGGDRAKWVRYNAESCESKWDMTNWVTISGKGGKWARFHFPPVPGPLILCYKFVYKGKPWMDPSAYIMHKNIRVNVVRFDKVTPNGTALGCQSNLTIEGKSFLGLGAEKTPNVTCGFGPDGEQTNATIVNDTHMTCLTTVPYIPDAFPLRVDYRGLNTLSDPYVFPGFRAFHYNNSEIYRVAPGAGNGVAPCLLSACLLTRHCSPPLIEPLLAVAYPRCRLVSVLGARNHLRQVRGLRRAALPLRCMDGLLGHRHQLEHGLV